MLYGGQNFNLPLRISDMRAVPLRLLAIATLVVAASCDRGATAPAAVPTGESATNLLFAPTTVSVVKRNTPLASPLSASAYVGLLGGQISIPAAGIKVVIPPLALTRTTRITVTAVAGSSVAYEFQPHGIRFLAPLLVTQNLVGTSAYTGGLLPPRLYAGYFNSLSDLDLLSNTGLVSELLGVVLNLNAKSATFPVFHFSGYLVATGKADGSDFDFDAR
jgi:hypothetical protein